MKLSLLTAGLFTARVLVSDNGTYPLDGNNTNPVASNENATSKTSFRFPFPFPSRCKCFPGDAYWPSTAQWNAFNRTVNGRLIATVPLASACHVPNYDAAKCQALKNEWQSPDIQ